MSGRFFIFGLGYSAQALARALMTEGWTVAGTTRTADSALNLQAAGFDALVHGPDQALDVQNPAFAQATHLLGSAPPGADGDPALAVLGSAIRALPDLAWTGYLSTTGVYGDRGGGEVEEMSALEPTSERSMRRVAAEADWRALDPSAHIFRLPGIYGPGRNALQQIVEGKARRILKPGHRFSRIHVADIVGAVRAAIADPHPGAIYNVVDDLPAESADVTAYAAELLGRPPPTAIPFEDAELSPMARSFYRDNKTVSNRRIKRELRFALKYPTYREGLAALAADYSAG